MKPKSLLPLFTTCAVLAFVQSAPAKEHHAAGISDAVFAKKAAAGGLTEVELGKLAAQNGNTQEVKDFGSKMVEDHGKANDALKAVADKDKLTIPDKPTADQQAMIDSLSKKSGAAFDKAYIHAMVTAHIKDKALFTAESENGSNPDLKQFATDTLPVIKEHLSMIEGISKGGSASAGMDMKPSNVGSAAESKSGAGPGGNANPVPTPASDAGTGMGTSPGTGSAADGKSGVGPGGNANPVPSP
jgi:putative membrane protein